MFDSSFGEFGKARSGLLLKKLPAGNAPISVPSGHVSEFVEAGQLHLTRILPKSDAQPFIRRHGGCAGTVNKSFLINCLWEKF